MAPRCRCVQYDRTLKEAIENRDKFFYPSDAPSANAESIKMYAVKKTDGTIDVTGIIDFNDGNSFKQLKNQIDSQLSEDVMDLNFEVTTAGGNAGDGLAIYGYLSELDMQVNVKGYGYVGSAGTMLLAAADHASIDETGLVLMHNPWTIAMGDYEKFENTAIELEALADQYALAYQNKTGKSKEEIKELMKKNRYMKASEAKKFGLIDEIRKPKSKASAQAQSQNQPRGNVMSKKTEAPETDIEALEKQIEDLKGDVAAKQKVIDGLDAKQVDEASIRADEREKALKELKEAEAAKATLKGEFEVLGIKTEGDDVEAILTSGIQSAGFNTDGFDTREQLEKLWASIKPTVTKRDVNAANEEIDSQFNAKQENTEFKDAATLVRERHNQRIGG